MKTNSKCGICGIYPKCLQNFASPRSYIGIFGILGTIQTMAFVYTSVTLTTLEKRFKIPSQTMGVLLSGIEISQALGVILIYYGDSGHRTRWISIGVAVSAISCLLSALPHFIYGAGQEALSLTHEYLNSTILSISDVKKDLPICSEFSHTRKCNDYHLIDTNIVPHLVFISQFILGIGNTMYCVFGQTYMDDSTKRKKNTPLLVGLTSSLRSVGPVFGFVLSYYCLKFYIDPMLHPIINDKNPRWLGAWWMGWIILALLMGIFSLLLAMFPRELRKTKSNKKTGPLSEIEVALKNKKSEQKSQAPKIESPTLKSFAASVKRVLQNKLFLFNTFGCIFFELSYAPYVYFISKYLEVQYSTSAGGGTLLTGPLKEIGMTFGFLISGFVIGRYTPSSRLVLGWNVIVGILYLVSNMSFMYMKCDTGYIQGIDLETMKSNFTNLCNAACRCEQVEFSPVCHDATGTTYFSACHAGCRKIINDTVFGDCTCVSNLDYRFKDTILESALIYIEDQFSNTFQTEKNMVTVGPCKQNCSKPYIIFSFTFFFAGALWSSVRVGTTTLNFRCVESRDKTLTQGIYIMLLSVLALIPGPIIAGALMDSTCLVWDVSCDDAGNCWIYDKDRFNYIVNISGATFIFIGTIFFSLLWYYSKEINLYGEEEELGNPETSITMKKDTMYNEVRNPSS